MDSIQPPTKPPRGVKNTKETSGLLMTVIRTLSKSDSNEQREQIRMKLEKEYKESNEGLHELVSGHQNDLEKVMNRFSNLSTQVTETKAKILAKKEYLIDCKRLLTCRREELKKLYVEHIDYKETLKFLEEIEQMKDVPSTLVNCFMKKDYLSATKMLVSSINNGENALKDVVGLQELKSELHVKKQELYTKLVAELKEQIYIRSTKEIVALTRQGSARDSADQSSPNASSSERKTPSKRSQFRLAKSLEVPGSAKHNKIPKNITIEFSDDIEFVVSNLIECVILLDKVPEFLEELKQSIERDLKDLIARTTKDLSSTESPSILLEFLQIVTEQFKKVLDMHRFILETLNKKQRPSTAYGLREVWLNMQSVLQKMLSEYLDMDNVKKIEQPTAENSTPGNSTEQYDISSFFTRKKYQRTVKGTLFKFADSAQTDGSHSVSKLREKERINEKHLLCKPSPSYITQIFVPLSRFSEDVEQIVNGGPSDQSSKLTAFLNEVVSKVFLGKRYEEIVGGTAPTADKVGSSTPLAKELNGAVQNTPSPLLTVSKAKRKRSLLFLR